MPRLVVAAPSQLAAEAGAGAAERSGNAVDAAVAAALVATVTEVGVCSIGGGGFITLAGPGVEALTIDGYAEMPGKGLPAHQFGGGAEEVWMGYGGGMTTLAGPGTIATPGGLAAFEAAVLSYGQASWRDALEPVAGIVRAGFPMSPTSYNYMRHAHDVLYGWHEPSRRAVHDGERLLEPGETIVIPDLAESLELLASEGTSVLYKGQLGERISADILAGGGILTTEDLARYEAVRRPALTVRLHEWEVATNPGPAVGGAALAAMLHLLGSDLDRSWTPAALERMVNVQEAVLGFRRRNIDEAEDRVPQIDLLLAAAARGDSASLLGSPSTIHVSAADTDGLACAITMSAGYGAGFIPAGTGMWMNNCLGEVELNRQGYHALTPGDRLVSNMAPTVVSHPGRGTLAVGSPGADRITTAILFTLVNLIHHGMPLEEAINHPRLHVEFTDEGTRVALEPGLDLVSLDRPRRQFEALDMFFGGASVARVDADGRLDAASDPRRGGGIAFG